MAHECEDSGEQKIKKSKDAAGDIEILNKVCRNGNYIAPKESVKNLRNAERSNSESTVGMKKENIPCDQYTSKRDPKKAYSQCNLEDYVDNISHDHPSITSPASNGEVVNGRKETICNGNHVFVEKIVGLDHRGSNCEVLSRTTGQALDQDKRVPGRERMNTSLPSQTQLPDIRDKGYAWVTIAVMFVCNLVTNGYMRSSGLICSAVVDAFPGTSTAHISLIISLLSSCRNISAPLVGAASVHFGYRPVMLVGVVICSAALFLSAFCSSVTMLAFTLGAMMGTGMGVLETPHVQVLSHYFHEKKELADSIRVSANPMGGITLPILLVIILEGFGLRITFIILSALMLQLMVFVCLIRPYRTHQIIVQARQANQEPKNVDPQSQKEKEMILQEQERLRMIPLQEKDWESCSPTKPKKEKKFDFKLFSNPIYYTYIAMICCWALAFPHTFYFLPMFGRSINLTAREMSFILTYQSIFDFLCRLVTGFMLNRKVFSKRSCFFVCMVIGGVGIVCLPFCRGVKSLVGAVSLVSACCTGFFTCLNGLLLDQFGRENIASSYGFMRMIQGIILLIIPPLLGLLVDVTGDYTVTFLVMGVGVTLAGVSIAVLPLVVTCSEKQSIKAKLKSMS